MRRSLLILIAAIAVTNADAQVRRASDYDRLLLPFHASVAGVQGRWRVQWWLRNDGTVPVDAFPLALGCGLPPPPAPDPPVFIVARPAVRPSQTLSCPAGDALPSVPVPGYIPVRGSVGAFLYVEKGQKQLTVSGTVGWEPPFETVDPPQLHAVPESAFRCGTGSVLPVPIAPDTRYALRIYALPETLDSNRIVIRVFEMQPQFSPRSEERLIATVAGELALQGASLPPCSGPCDLPQVPLAPAIYQLFDLPKPERGFQFQSPMRVEISPESPNVQWWAVVSATDNPTQRIRLFQPPF